MNYVFLLHLIIGSPSFAASKTTDFKFNNEDGWNCTASYDPSKVNVAELANASYYTHQLSRSALLRSLAYCNQEQDSKFKDCGNRKYGALNYLYNAKVNLNANEEQLKEWEQKKVPESFEKIKLAVLQDNKFWQWLKKTVYSYLESKDLKVLQNAKYEKLDIASCGLHLKSLSSKSSDSEIESAVYYNWNNCVNLLRKTIEIATAKAAWKNLILSEACEEPNEDFN